MNSYLPKKFSQSALSVHGNEDLNKVQPNFHQRSLSSSTDTLRRIAPFLLASGTQYK